MIVFIDQKNKKIEMYDKKGLISISFNESWKLKNYIKEGKVLYITNAIETTMDKIMETVDSIRGFSPNADGTKNTSNNKEPLYIHTIGREYINMKSIGIMFKGATDFYSVGNIKKQFGNDVFEKDDTLRAYMNNGKLEIMTSSEMSKFLLEYKDSRTEKLEKQRSSMILNGKVDDFLDGGEDVDAPDREGAIPIDLGKSNFRGGGSTENEGSLLPEDF